jgi:hypothetical protein
MADDRMLRERVRGAALIPAPSPNLQGVTRRARVLRVRRIGAAVAVAVVAAAAVIVPLVQLSGLGDATVPATLPDEQVIRFQAAPGWHVAEFVPPEGLGFPSAWAANVPFAPEDVAGESPTLGYPDSTIETLPRDGVVLVASIVVESRNPLPADPQFPDASLVLDEPMTGFEGQRPGTSQAVASATVNGRFVHVFAMFGAATVSAGTLGDANEQLARLIVAPAPSPTGELDDFGVRMQVPDDWHRLLFSGGGSAELRAGTMPITDLYEGIPGRQQMGSDDLAVVLSESIAVQDRFEPIQLPISLRAEDECPTCEILDNGAAPPVGHTLFARTFSVGDRRFLLYAEFGSSAVSDADLQALNDVLATLEIDASGSLEPSDPGATPTTLPPGPSFTATETTPFEYLGLRLDVPAGWTALAAPLAEPAVAPVVAAFGSWPLPAGGDCGPEPALAALPADGALVWINEHPSPNNRGDYYQFVRYAHDPTTQPMRWECGAEAPSRMELWDVGNGRYLEAHVALGPAVGPERVAEVEALLNSLRAGIEPAA